MKKKCCFKLNYCRNNFLKYTIDGGKCSIAVTSFTCSITVSAAYKIFMDEITLRKRRLFLFRVCLMLT